MKGFICRCKCILFCLLVLGSRPLSAQAPLPDFSVADKGNGTVVISWVNPFPNTVQVAVQRSFDSVRRFTTVYSAGSPELPQNGFTDKTFYGVKVYYRIFYTLDGGTYFFTKVKRPSAGIRTGPSEIDLHRDKVTETIKDIVTSQPEHKFFVKLHDSVLTTLMDGDYTRFKDSIIHNTRDTLLLMLNDTILLRRYNPPFVYRTSIYVYPNHHGYIVLDLPEAGTKKYDLIVFEEDNTPIMEIKAIKSTYLTLDKADFYHSGWYNFELWENGKLKEKNKFFLAKEF